MIAASGPAASEGLAPNLVPPPGNPRFPLFDALRAIAALSVFAGHTVTGLYTLGDHPSLFIWAAGVADQGVAIFFLISGFLLYRPFLVARLGGPRLGLGAYARRRFLRIAPAYWAALSILLAAGLIGGLGAGNWWIFYGFGQIYEADTLGQGIGVAWTLCIEVSFYAVLPLFAYVCSRLSPGRRSVRPDVLLLVVLAAASLAWRAHYSSLFDIEKVSTLAGTFFWFALGMGLAIASLDHHQGGREVSERTVDWTRRLPRNWPVASWGAAGLLFVARHELQLRPNLLGRSATAVVLHMLYGLVALSILLPAVFAERDSGPVSRLLRIRALAWIGLVSYAFYLYHATVIARLERAIGGSGSWWRYPAVTAAALVISLSVAAVSYYVLERPLMRLGRLRR